MKGIILCLTIIAGFKISLAQAMDELPFLNIGGNAGTSSMVSLKADLRATNLKDSNCYSFVYRSGLRLKIPHTYSVISRSFADYYGKFYLDIDLDSRLLRKLREEVDSGELLLEGLTPFDYKKMCQFEVKGVEFNVDDTFLVFKQVNQTVFLNLFEVIRGTTSSQDFDFSKSPHIIFDIHVIEGK